MLFFVYISVEYEYYYIPVSFIFTFTLLECVARTGELLNKVFDTAEHGWLSTIYNMKKPNIKHNNKSFENICCPHSIKSMNPKHQFDYQTLYFICCNENLKQFFVSKL